MINIYKKSFSGEVNDSVIFFLLHKRAEPAPPPCLPSVTVGCDARYTGAGPGRLHLNACLCGIESIAGRMPGDRRMREGNER
jgi:hypothetical protein